MKTLWIMRHGEAEWEANSDVERQLTNHGEEETHSVASKLELDSNFTLWHSPYRRAKQTAHQLVSALPQEPDEILDEKLLTPDADPAVLAQFIEHSEADNLFLVSHMPLVARLTQELTKDDRIGGFQTAQVVQCEQDADQQWRVKAIYAPDRSS